jgi:hypothetical protein
LAARSSSSSAPSSSSTHQAAAARIKHQLTTKLTAVSLCCHGLSHQKPTASPSQHRSTRSTNHQHRFFHPTTQPLLAHHLTPNHRHTATASCLTHHVYISPLTHHVCISPQAPRSTNPLPPQ